jgi:hypothetical protein
VGGNALIPNATMLVQQREWDARMDPDIVARHALNRHDFDLGHKLHLIDGNKRRQPGQHHRYQAALATIDAAAYAHGLAGK